VLVVLWFHGTGWRELAGRCATVVEVWKGSIVVIALNELIEQVCSFARTGEGVLVKLLKLRGGDGCSFYFLENAVEVDLMKAVH
jgi:hypothetical protein